MKKVSIVIPAFDEEASISTLIDRVVASDACGLHKEIIVVNDGSTDGTQHRLAESKARHAHADLRVVTHGRNRGKGASLRTGFSHATGDVILIQDADLETNPSEYPRLLRPILAGSADVVYGSRFLNNGARSQTFLQFMGNRILTIFMNLVTNLKLTDMETCYKVFRRDILEHMTLQQDRFGFEPEVTAKFARLNLRVHEVPVSYERRSYDEGKKISWRDGVSSLYCIFRYGFFR